MADAQTSLRARFYNISKVGGILGVWSDVLTPDGAALVAEAVGAERVWWCVPYEEGAPYELRWCRDGSHPDDDHGGCGWRWLLPATAPEEDG